MSLAATALNTGLVRGVISPYWLGSNVPSRPQMRVTIIRTGPNAAPECLAPNLIQSTALRFFCCAQDSKGLRPLSLARRGQ